MTSGYRRGADTERWLVERARSHGRTALRTAGSHGEADVFVFAPNHAWALNVKRNAWAAPAERVALYRTWGECSIVTPLLACAYVRVGKPTEWHFRWVMRHGLMGEDFTREPWLS